MQSYTLTYSGWRRRRYNNRHNTTFKNHKPSCTKLSTLTAGFQRKIFILYVSKQHSLASSWISKSRQLLMVTPGRTQLLPTTRHFVQRHLHWQQDLNNKRSSCTEKPSLTAGLLIARHLAQRAPCRQMGVWQKGVLEKWYPFQQDFTITGHLLPK